MKTRPQIYYTSYGGTCVIFFSKEPRGTLMKIVEICSEQVFLLFSMSEIQTGHQTWTNLA